jgi:lipopolysaccharide export system protein LptA
MTASRNRLSAAVPFVILMALTVTEARSALPAGVSGLDANAPIAVNADNFLADLNGETLLYTGNVIVTQGMTRLHADRVKVSASGGKASRVEADGHVVVDTPSGQAVGDSGVYDVAEQMLRLTGNVVLTKDANVMRGGALEVSMATGMARLTPVPGQSQGRVQGLFVPRNDAGASPAARGAPPKGSGNPPKP